MTYSRVIPRDLFNEGNLLTCLGRLSIKLGERKDHRAGLSEGAGQRLLIEQDPADGSISVVNLAFGVGGKAWRLFRPLNARDPWPLWARDGDVEGEFEDYRVFDFDGELSPEFWIAITEPGA